MFLLKFNHFIKVRGYILIVGDTNEDQVLLLHDRSNTIHKILCMFSI